jgi:hypothetical protein
MGKIKISLGGALVVLAVGLLCAWPAPVTAQTTEPPVTDPQPADPPAGDGTETEAPSTAHPPGYIGELLKAGDLTQEQVDQMRTTGYGWGEVRLATRLAQRLAGANGDGTPTFADALKQVTDARAAGQGWGQIAADNNLKIGGLVGNRQAPGNAQKGSAAQKGSRIRANEVVDGDEEVSPDPAKPPAFITKLVEAQVVTQDQVNAMLTAGYGWGEVRIATLLSQKIAENSSGTLTFTDALKQVMDARAAGKDFGQIAADNNLKVGDLVRHQKAGDATTAKGKKPGFFARVGRALGFGRSADKTAKPAAVDKPQAAAKGLQGDKPERPAKPERATMAERPERPERLAQPERPERPERPARTERPERPERGPRM